jgi:hypothetical protein
MNEFITLLIGWVLGVLSKVLGDQLSRVVRGPRLDLEFREKGNFISHTTLTGNGQSIPCRYVRVKVTNTGQTSARNCRGFLIGLERKSKSGDFELVNGGDDTIQLIWSHASGNARGEGFDMSPGVARYLDVLSTAEGRRHFNIECPRIPNTLIPCLDQHGTYRLTILASAEEAEPKEIRLVFEWNGDWQNSKVYMDASTYD